jgi:hypothetical protein
MRKERRPYSEQLAHRRTPHRSQQSPADVAANPQRTQNMRHWPLTSLVGKSSGTGGSHGGGGTSLLTRAHDSVISVLSNASILISIACMLNGEHGGKKQPFNGCENGLEACSRKRTGVRGRQRCVLISPGATERQSRRASRLQVVSAVPYGRPRSGIPIVE